MVCHENVQPILGDGIRLRALTPEDLPLTLGWRNRDDIRCWFVFSEELSPEQHASWYEQYRNSDDDFVFVIETGSNAFTPVGQVSLYRIEWELKRAEYGRLMIGEDSARGKGIAREATKLLLQYATQELQLREIYLSVFKANTRAIAVYKACGFVETEGDKGLIKMTWQPADRIPGREHKPLFG